MSTHASAETLSAYLDQELSDEERRLVEQHLDDCESCQERYAGLTKVVSGLRHLERMAPPSTLGQMVTRRIAFEGEQTSLLDRLENNLGSFEKQSSLLALFGLVIAFAVMILFFAQALEQRRNSTIPVIFQDPVSAPAHLEAGDRVFVLDEGVWVEKGVEAEPVRFITADSAEWDALFANTPDLARLANLPEPVILRAGDEVVRLEPRPSTDR